jgi:hypothetical protein
MIVIRHFRCLAFVAVLLPGGALAQNLQAPQTLVVPAGTRIITVLSSPLHTTSAVPDSGIYVESLVPIVIDNHVAIPAHSLIQGTVETAKRPGHFDRSSRLRFHFTTLIFPNNQVSTIDALLQSIPGSNYRKKDPRGTAGTVDQVEKTLPDIGAFAAAGALFGTISRTGIGGLGPGAALGAGVGVGKVLLGRGDPIVLHEGTRMEIVLQAPVTVSQQSIPSSNIVSTNQSSALTSNTNDPTASVSSMNVRNAVRPVQNPWPMQRILSLPWY